MNTYEAYLGHKAGDILKAEDALRIYNEVTDSVRNCGNNEVMEFYEDFVSKACKYTEVRMRWEFWNDSEKMAEDQGRTIRHNAVIDAINILSRFLKSEGVETPWRDELGDGRKKIGDFACFVGYITGICNR